ncbi:3-methylcrotonyl-CoA carboxylase subunit alpha [Polymorphobacter glacialis]|uniref:3-methylcrotonyl-CoA carboxylase subunit alpha n=1 Tax=Sandarakinorhabdus glacialis TaxID=1614636 RepID=A0A917E3B4_9SPHN|nr:biotin carboxylase N-terminal domain-containing protein [Polymorphobacter glacialis]GGE00985.1 3-methylcrotonyl-CoA carboxylase subunit alpha [Polymorphobacter glacialis]
MHKLLIANRGEIARRIIRTAHAMDIATVAVYSDPDAASPHVREAGQSVAIGPAEARPYLDIDAIIAAARRTGADAIHPGYGFLSENADFAKAVRKAGLIFVGPPEAAMRVMALKDSAKSAMKKAGVPITPGYQGTDQSLVRLERAAEGVGFPLLIKAVAGGGGKGMRAVHDPAEFQDALMAAQREGQNSFGNAGVMLEKLIQRPRHVEVQVFADRHGNVVHLFERDCSLQRRHQKVIEEAPAPGLSDRLRHTLGIAAVTAATAIAYEGAGTVEFILDLDAVDANGDPAFYFMEMNTRLQVEHPVTECITGFDLVEWQLRVARDEMLPASQEAIAVTGHAVEARLYAEDPDSGFLPSTGTLTRLDFGTGAAHSGAANKDAEGVRIDTGVETGSTIGLDYDPMIAKVIAWGPNRGIAIDRLVAALGGTIVEGLKSNRAFLARLADHPAFRDGDVDTGFIVRHADALAPASAVPETALLLAALAAVLPETPAAPAASPFARSGFRLNLPEERSFRFWTGDTMYALTVRAAGDHRARAAGSGRFRLAGLETIAEVGARRENGGIVADIGGRIVTGNIVTGPDAVEVRLGGQTYILSRRAPRKDAVTGASDGRIIAPMPGRVLAVDAIAGQAVAAGDRLLVLEAMKMEHRITARAAGTITAVHITEGDQIADGMLLVEIA